MRKLIGMLKVMLAFLPVITSVTLSGCQEFKGKKNWDLLNSDKNWKEQLNEKLNLLGHRNWILVVDKAFPEQNAAGMEYVYVNEGILPVLKQVLTKINLSNHVKPIIYQDKDLGFITENQAAGVKHFIEESKIIFGNQTVETMLHDSVFRKLDIESKLFKILVIKTNETIPYTSVFLQLDCAYWNVHNEKRLRDTLDTR
jgi:D-ribose pyranose/furanose isomerase RbsD